MTTLVQTDVQRLEEIRQRIAATAAAGDLEALDELVTGIARQATADALKSQVRRPAIGGPSPASPGEPLSDVSRDMLTELVPAWDRNVISVKTAYGLMRLPSIGIYNPHRAAEWSGPSFPSLAHFLRAARDAKYGIPDARLKVLGEGDGGTGGFLTQEDFRAMLLMMALEEAVVRPRATVIPMASEITPIPAIHETTHATSVYGGVVAYWEGESATLTASEPTFRQIRLQAKKLNGYTSASNELLADSAIPLEALLVRLFSDALRFYEDEAYINGTGAGQPLGLLNAPALIQVAAETGQAAATIVSENLDKMWSRMLPRSMNRAVWLANPDTWPQLAALSRNVGTGGSAVMMNNMAGGPPNTIYGRPLIFTEHGQTLGTLGDIYLVDLSYYLLGDRQQLSIDSSPHVRFTNNETVWRFIQRVDGQPWVQSAITPRYGSNTLSPFVALATRS